MLKVSQIFPAPLYKRVTLAIGAILVYGSLFYLTYPLISRSVVAFALIPLITLALIFGRWAGLLAGFLSVPLNLLLFYHSEGIVLGDFIGRNFWSTHLAFIGIGWVFGYVADLRLRVKIELDERRKSEAEKEHLVAELKKTLDEVKALSGMLPICANCKKIRDDKGYWNQIESYIENHSEALFSHSICPECTEELYPEISRKKIEKQR